MYWFEIISLNTNSDKESEVYKQDTSYGKNEDELNGLFISGGEDEDFEAKMIEFYGVNWMNYMNAPQQVITILELLRKWEWR